MLWSRSRWQQKASVRGGPSIAEPLLSIGACNLKPGRCARPDPLRITVSCQSPISRRRIVAFALPREWNVSRHPPLVFFESFPKMRGEQLIFDAHANLGAYHEDQE